MKCSRQTSKACANGKYVSLVSFGYACRITEKDFGYLGYQDREANKSGCPFPSHIQTLIIPPQFVLFLFFHVINHPDDDAGQSLLRKTETDTTPEVKQCVEGRQIKNKAQKIIQQVLYTLNSNSNPSRKSLELHYGNTISLHWQSKR